MLRSRTKTDDTPRQFLSGFADCDVENQLSNKSSARFRRMGSSRLKICLVMVFFLLVIGLDRLRRWRDREANYIALVPPYTPQVGTRTQRNPEAGGGAWNSTQWRYPLVDRMMLRELDQLQDLFTPSAFSFPSDDQVWQPHVRRLPDDPSRSRSANENVSRSTNFPEGGICQTPTHPQPCRFLFPVRIAEQESKARIHLLQLAELARRLNRTLVLPKVGKSKIGACFRWSFETYYDVDSLNSSLSDAPAVVDQKDFQVWLEGLEQNEDTTVRLFSVGPSVVPRMTTKRELASDKIDEVRVYDVEPYNGWRSDIPGCMSKIRWLDGLHPTFMTVAQPTLGKGSDLLSESMVVALSDESLSKSGGYPPQILMLDWNLRHPLFPHQSLRYSRNLVGLAGRLAPSSAYLVVHWRMETVEPSVLIDCAHALVDLLVRLLYDESIAPNVTTVWFASDYPYPIARRTNIQPRPALEAKSGTFREFEIRHEEAVQVLRNAFEVGGELDRWKVTDISEAMEDHAVDKELSNDAGVLGILDKLIGIQANLFVSGSNRCARRSSFTNQIVEGRMGTRRREDLVIENIVDTFG